MTGDPDPATGDDAEARVEDGTSAEGETAGENGASTEAEATGEHGASAEAEAAGERGASDATGTFEHLRQRLAALDDLPVEEHPAVFEEIHAALVAELDGLEEV